MRKLFVLVVFGALVYAIAAVAAHCLLPQKLAASERRQWGVRAAIAQLIRDQKTVSERVKVITDTTIGQGKTKVDEVTALLDDNELNRIAERYHASEWAERRSTFLGHVSHSRSLQEEKDAKARNVRSDKEGRIRELLSKRRTLQNKLRTPYEERTRLAALADVERELLGLDMQKTENGQFIPGKEKVRHCDEQASKEKETMFGLATASEEATLGNLNRVMAERLADLRWQEREPARIREVSSWFDVKLLGHLIEMAKGGSDEK